jgi:hypothetical protein
MLCICCNLALSAPSQAYKVQRLSKRIGSSYVMRWSDLARMDLAHYAPSRHVSQRKGEDEHDDDPASCTSTADHAVRSIQAPNNEHAEHEKQAAGDDNGPAAELVHGQKVQDL